MKNHASLLLALCCLLTLSTHATDHLVSTTEEAVQWLNKAPAGDRVILKDGTYTNAIVAFNNANGTVERPVMFIAEHAGKVFFEGNSTLSFSGNYVVVEGFVWQNGGKDLQSRSVIEFKNGSHMAMHCTLQDCVIDSYNNSDLNSDNKWVSLFGQYNTVARCLLHNKRNRGATLTVWLVQDQPAHHTVVYNYFLERQNGPNVDNGLESIRVGDSKTSFTAAHCVVALNRFENCDGEIEIISNKSCHNSYLHNTFYNSDGGLTLRHGNDCLCDGNYFDGGSKKSSYGIRFIGEGHVAVNNYFYRLQGAHEGFRAPVTMVNGIPNSVLNGYFQVRRAVVANNIFVNCQLPDLRLGASTRAEATLPPDTVTISGNTFFDDLGTAGNVYEARTKAGHVYIENNKVSGKRLQLPVEKGFTAASGLQRDDKGILVVSLQHAAYSNTGKAGADEVPAFISAVTQKTTYTILLPADVGPLWKRGK